MRRVRDERGQTSAEYLGMVVAVAFLIGALAVAGPGIGSAVKSGIQGVNCHIGEGGSCESPPEMGPTGVSVDGAAEDAEDDGGNWFTNASGM